MKKLNTDDFRILVGLEIAQKRLRLEYRPNTRVIHPEVNRAINEAWARKTTQLKGAMTGTDDSHPLYRYESHVVTRSEVIVYLGGTDYRETYGTNVSNPDLAQRFGVDSLGNGLAVCGLILGSDDTFLMLRRSQKVHDKPGWWHTVGGHFERSKMSCQHVPDIEKALEHEVKEELPGLETTIESFMPVCLVQSVDSYKPEICYILKTGIQLTRVGRLELSFEHTDYIVLPCTLSAITEFLNENWEEVVASTKALLYHLCLIRFDQSRVLKDWGALE